MKDEFETTVERQNRIASEAFGGEVEFVGPVEIPDPRLVGELRTLLSGLAKINTRLRKLTGEAQPDQAVARARELIEIADNQVTVRTDEPEASLPPDDRDTSTSVRTLRGGSPTLGRRRK